jgi:hypothetical protein
MATTTKTTSTKVGISIPEFKMDRVELFLVGVSPLIMNSMSNHVQQQLLAPPPRKSMAERATKLKHDPMAEYRNSMYYMRDQVPTLLGMPATAFKKAMTTAALDSPGAKKAQIGRLTFVESDMVPIYGVPQLFCAVTRSSDIAKTPDVRTRAILPAWAARVVVTFAASLMKYQDIVNLMAFAGVTAGVGDWRQEKGSGSYGRWRLASVDDPEFTSIVSNGNVDAQVSAREVPTMYDQETANLMKWFFSYTEERGFAPTR